MYTSCWSSFCNTSNDNNDNNNDNNNNSYNFGDYTNFYLKEKKKSFIRCKSLFTYLYP